MVVLRRELNYLVTREAIALVNLGKESSLVAIGAQLTRKRLSLSTRYCVAPRAPGLRGYTKPSGFRPALQWTGRPSSNEGWLMAMEDEF